MMIFGWGEFAQVVRAKLKVTSEFIVHREFYEKEREIQPKLYGGFVNQAMVYEEYISRPRFTHDPPPTEEQRKWWRPFDKQIILAIGPGNLNKNRERIYNMLKEDGFTVEGFNNGEVVPGVLGNACVYMEQVNIQPYAYVEENVVIWSQSHIGHHSRIGAHSFITSHVCIAGGVKIGKRCFIGCSATVLDHVTVGDDCIIQAGSVVDRDVPNGSVWGRDGLSKVPAHRVKL